MTPMLSSSSGQAFTQCTDRVRHRARRTARRGRPTPKRHMGRVGRPAGMAASGGLIRREVFHRPMPTLVVRRSGGESDRCRRGHHAQPAQASMKACGGRVASSHGHGPGGDAAAEHGIRVGAAARRPGASAVSKTILHWPSRSPLAIPSPMPLGQRQAPSRVFTTWDVKLVLLSLSPRTGGDHRRSSPRKVDRVIGAPHGDAGYHSAGQPGQADTTAEGGTG
jgi:hypothetical protein